MSNTTTNPAPTFHKRQRGLYGTGVWRDRWSREHVFCHDTCTRVEVCIDGYTDRDGWFVRYVCDHDHFSDVLGEWFPTLRDAKAYFVERGVPNAS